MSSTEDTENGDDGGRVYSEQIGTRVTEEMGNQLEEIAFQRSEPGDWCSVSEVVREILDDNISDYHQDSS